MILGFTGTRLGMTPAQRVALPSVLATLPERVLHGGAEGADEEFHIFVWNRSMRQLVSRLAIEVYPIGEARRVEWREMFGHERGVTLHVETDDPLARNRIIATRCDHLLAFPDSARERMRSGTWATVRYARAAGKPVTLVLPDGQVREEKR